MGEAALTFTEVDDLGFAAERGRLNGSPFLTALGVTRIGPILELIHLSFNGTLPNPIQCSWLSLGRMRQFLIELGGQRRHWVCPHTRKMGYLRTERALLCEDTSFVSFGLAAQQGAIAAGVPKQAAAQLVGALGELHSNIYEHSEAPESGLIAFNTEDGVFEFVAADVGIGVLKSLSTNSEYMYLKDHGTALQLALTDGCSRYGTSIGRGKGFRPLFIGLANLHGELRFRTGDHALTIDGSSPSPPQAKIEQKAVLRGFFASIRCVLQNRTSNQ